MHNDFYRIHLLDTERRKLGPSHRCEHCGANMLCVGDYGWPHFCKELTYMSMPTLRFEQFPVTNEPRHDHTGRRMDCDACRILIERQLWGINPMSGEEE